MTPTRIQLAHMLHGVTGGPRALLTVEKGDSFTRQSFHGLDGWLVTDSRSKTFWVPDSAVVGIDVDCSSAKPYLASEDAELARNLAATPPGGIESWAPEHVCTDCGKRCATNAALQGHRRAKHPEPTESAS